MNVTVRPMQEEDVGFIVHSFGRSAYWGSGEKQNRSLWLESFKPYVTEAVLYGHARVACLAEDPKIITGWALFVGAQLQFAYVKSAYRHHGIATLLTQGHFATVNPRYVTKKGTKWLESIVRS